jgi:MYXO-CTERM domain-containing protein
MIFVASSPTQTTLYDMIKYSGSPSSFAWVLPIHGTVTVGLSSDTVFAALDQLTAPTFVPPVLPPCPVPSNCPGCDFLAAGAAGSSSGGSSGSSSGGPPPVTVLGMATVGPYDTVQLQSTDPAALNNWLTTNGYNVPTDVQPIIAAYVTEGFNFLAMRLSPGQGIQAMRPVSVTTQGAGSTLPLRMVAAGTGSTVGVTLWVISQARMEPAHSPSFTIAASDLVWDWNTGMSNYTTLVQQKETAMANAAWQVESSMDIAPYTVEDLVLGTGGFGSSSSGGANPTTEGYTGSDGGDAAVTAQQERSDDLQTLFPPSGGSSVRITRLRADLSRAALASDLALKPATDPSVLSSQYTVTKSVNAPVCPNPPVCPCGGFVGGASSSGAGTSSGTGGTGSSATPTTAGGSGCSTSTSEPGGSGVDFLLMGIAGAMVFGSRRRRRRP